MAHQALTRFTSPDGLSREIPVERVLDRVVKSLFDREEFLEPPGTEAQVRQHDAVGGGLVKQVHTLDRGAAGREVGGVGVQEKVSSQQLRAPRYSIPSRRALNSSSLTTTSPVLLRIT